MIDDANQDEFTDAHAVVDALLQERLGGELPHDLATAVATRRLRGEGRAAARACTVAARPAASGQRWLVAAIMLLAIGAIVGAQWWRRAEATGGATAPTLPVTAPVQDPQPAGENGVLQLRVLDDHGAPVPSFTLTMLRVFDAAKSQYGGVPEAPERQVRLADFTGDYLHVTGLPEGKLAVLVKADDYAGTLSTPFVMPKADQPGPVVTVQLTLGSELTGVITDPAGKPVADAEVRTVASAMIGLPAGSMFAKMSEMMPKVATRATVRTDGEGRFRLRRLTPGSYGVVIEHPDFCRFEQKDVAIAAAPTKLDFTLAHGTRISGTLHSDGEAVADVDVTLQVAEALPQPGDNRATFPPTWIARTDAQGHFAFAVCIPPGKYRMSSTGKVTGKEAPFDLMRRAKSSEVEFVVEPGKKELEQAMTVQ